MTSVRKAFAVRSRRLAKEFLCDQPWAAISVSTYQEELPVLSDQNRVGLLQLCFWDIANPSMSGDEQPGRLFTREQARQILDFAASVWDQADCFLVHCEAGMSRSPAIAAALNQIYYGEDKEYFSKFHPNYFVYKMILEEHYGPSSEQVELANRMLQEMAYTEPTIDDWELTSDVEPEVI